jgi:hypothetical protein
LRTDDGRTSALVERGLAADLQVGEQAAVFVAERAVEADFFFAAGLEDGVSLLIGNANAELLDDHAPGVGKAEDLVGKAESHGGSISPVGRGALSGTIQNLP